MVRTQTKPVVAWYCKTAFPDGKWEHAVALFCERAEAEWSSSCYMVAAQGNDKSLFLSPASVEGLAAAASQGLVPCVHLQALET
jgi:hypothetical protein